MAGTGTAHLRPVDEVLLQARAPGGRLPGRRGQEGVGRGRRELRRGRGRDARRGRRERVREVDLGPGAHAAPGSDQRVGALRGPRPHPREGRAPAGAAPPAPDRVPGPDQLAQPAPQGGRHRRCPAEDLEDRHPGRAARQGRRRPRDRGPRSRRGARQAPARVLGRPVPAHLHRPGAGARTEGPDLRRAGVRARRVGAGADPQPARGPQGPLRAHAGVHHPRPGGREERQRPRGGHVPGQAVRAGHARPALRRARASVHGGPAVGDPGARPDRARRGRRPGARRPAVARGAAERLPVPHPLPAGRGALRRRGAADP